MLIRFMHHFMQILHKPAKNYFFAAYYTLVKNQHDPMLKTQKKEREYLTLSLLQAAQA